MHRNDLWGKEDRELKNASMVSEHIILEQDFIVHFLQTSSSTDRSRRDNKINSHEFCASTQFNTPPHISMGPSLLSEAAYGAVGVS